LDSITSTQFRQRYASLTQPTVVTVSGHPIGTWVPAPPSFDETAIRQRWLDIGKTPTTAQPPIVAQERFNSRPFTPAPKK
jgi:hypothetical protein